MSVGGEFGRRVSDDELCAEVRQAVEGGDEDALRRLGFGGFGGYVQRLSEIMSDSVTDGLDPSADDFGAIMGEVASPARYAHHLVNEAGTAIQSAKDKPLGIHIKPAEPDFDDDALCGTVGCTHAVVLAASMDSPERAVKTLADGLGYAVKKAGNDFIKANAEQRSRAGFEVGVKRSGDSKCCEWCAARIGSWALKNAPDGVFGCHANCSCTVEYTSSTGAKTSASGANLHRFGTGAFVEVEYQPPHVMTHEEAKEKGGFDEPKRLTGGGKRGTMYADEGTKEFPLLDIVPKLNYFRDERLNQVVTTAAQDIMHELKKHKNITEAGFVVSITPPYTRSSIVLGETDRDGVVLPQCTELGLNIHNHPSGNPFTSHDIDRFVIDEKAKYMCVIGNNGKWYVLEKEKGFDYLEFYHKAALIPESEGFAKTVLKGAENYGFKYYEA